MNKNILLIGLLIVSIPAAYAGKSSLKAVLKGEHRSEAFVARDKYRNPKETLKFFGVKPKMTVVEIWPGGGGWYTEILAPYLRDKGKLYAAQFNPDSDIKYFQRGRKKFLEKIAAKPDIYDRVEVTTFDPPEHVDIAPPASADYVLTFRNVHNWYMYGSGEERLVSAFKAFYDVLKPGGLLGVVEHRLPASRPLSDQDKSGYMRQDYVIQIAEKVGFKLVDESEINANPKDTADHPKGVWTLPPSLRLKDKDRERYVAIGESDRMTLKFKKPKAAK